VPPSAPDELDTRIVDALVSDARASHRSIASEVGVAASTVSKRLQDLESSGAIQGYRPLLDYAKFGYPVVAIVHLRTTDAPDAPMEVDVAADRVTGDHADSRCLGRVLAGSEEVPSAARAALWTTVHRVTGSFDFLTIGRFPNRRTVAEAVVELRSTPAVVATKTEFVVDTIRDNASIPLP
jgi:DNA-binding Lrp family transcriptional regulator